MKHFTKFLIAFMLLLGFTALAQPNIRVRGNTVDIWNVSDYNSDNQVIFSLGDRKDWEIRDAVPGQNHIWPSSRPALISGKDYATTPRANATGGRATSLDSFSVDVATSILIAIPTNTLNASGWTATGGSFNSSISTFYYYTYDYSPSEGWVDFPYYDDDKPTIIFAERGHIKWDNPKTIDEFAEGVLIWDGESTYNRSGRVYDPNIIIMPNGDYIAGIKNRLFKSTDKGLTWSLLSNDLQGIWHASVFLHNGELYLIGDRPDGDARITKSTDGGQTWQPLVNLNFKSRNVPSEVLVGNGRIWFANEEYESGIINLASAPVNSDLMDPNSWVRTNRTDSNPRTSRTDQEPCMIMDTDGWPIAMPEKGPPIKAGSVTGAGRMFDRSLFNLDGSGSKFTALYDDVTGKYYALTSIGDPRSALALHSSYDLQNWTLEQELFRSPASRFHGFNYPFMKIDGDDLIFVLRMAFENERGQPIRWHDANMFTFHRVRNFRDLSPCSVIPYYNVNNTGWELSGDGSVTVDAGGSVEFGPQSNVDSDRNVGSWSWTGPNGFTANTREILISNLGPSDVGTYTATNTNSNNCESSFEFYVDGAGYEIPPTVSFAAPVDGATFSAGDNIGTVEVLATDSDGSISNVNLYLDGSATSIRQENGFPYEWNAPGQNDPALQTLSAGTHTLRAVAVDNEGAIGEAT
uniref:Ig-like domain-containing protein n=1 Tax=Nonlabens xiamenensis TaxID=2341043 RepID=UPI000F6123C3